MLKELGFWILTIMKAVCTDWFLCTGQCPHILMLQITSNGILGKLPNLFELLKSSDKNTRILMFFAWYFYKILNLISYKSIWHKTGAQSMLIFLLFPSSFLRFKNIFSDFELLKNFNSKARMVMIKTIWYCVFNFVM